MRVIFAGRDNAFNRGIVKWLQQDHEVIACLFLEPDRFTLKGRMKRLKKRAQRYGFIKVIDELAFHIYDRIFLRKAEKPLFSQFPKTFLERQELDCPTYDVQYINSKKWVEFVKSLEPDLIYSVCSSVIFKPQLYNIPKYGTLVLHEGLTPEYKGLHTPIWALINNEPQYLGYTLLKVNDEIDGGEVISQGGYELKPGEGVNTWSFVAHNAIIANLEKMRTDMNKYFSDPHSFKQINLSGRKSGYYTWIGISDVLKKKNAK